ncbi:glutaredoxin-like protein NrdH [Vibrio sp. TRT 21S02]|uniref:glutaredoxin-like protein NrdH n=1 Tax=Vibrio sp. TRT 21S02 TaxID=3418507 RepID=UPI003CE7A144
MDVIIYSKPACVQCVATQKAMAAKNIRYKSIDLTQDSHALEKVQALGYREVPVVVVGERHWSGFRPDMINTL